RFPFRVFHPSSSSFNRFLHPLWPASRDMFSSLEQNMIRTVEEIKASMKFMDQFHQQLLQEMTLHQNKSVPVLSGGTIKPREDSFTLHLEVQDFSPQELTVKLVGKKLLVTGAKESKCEDGKGSFSYKCQLFRKEADLPDDVIAEKLSCNVTANGQLQIEAPRSALPDGQERTVPIQLPAVTQSSFRQLEPEMYG
uniref:SHSP domain-containing protein n=1 Tax=Leptobrachium leishanense TaxID=445787 RepID=A0A8C5PKP5_9ANUR